MLLRSKKVVLSKITPQKLARYHSLSSKALEIIKSSIVKGQEAKPKEVIEMVEAYLSDSQHFKKNKDFINAFACVNYAHGWIDASCRLGIFKVNNSKVFAVDENKENMS